MTDVKVIILDRARDSSQILPLLKADKVLLIGDLSYSVMKELEEAEKRSDLLMISTTSMQPDISNLLTAFSICFDARLLAAFYLMLKGCGINIKTPPALEKIMDDFGIDIDVPISAEVQSTLEVVPVFSDPISSYGDLLLEDARTFIQNLDGLGQNFSKRYLITLWNNFVLFSESDPIHSRFNTVDYRTSLPSYGKINVHSPSHVYTLEGSASEPFMMTYMTAGGDDSFYTSILQGQEDTSRLHLTMINARGETVC